MERQFKSGYTDAADTPFENYANGWLERQTTLSSSTRESYRRMLKRVYPMIGSIPLNKLRPIALENMLSVLRKKKHRGKLIQEKTAQKHLTVVSAVLSDAKRNQLIEKNPARMIDLPLAQRKVQHIPSPAEARRFMDLLVDMPYLFGVYYMLAIYTGCRRGELCALQDTDFTWNEDGLTCILTVSRSRSVVPGNGICEGPTKNKKPRQFYLNQDMTNMVRDLMWMRGENAKKHRRKESTYLFVNERQQLIHPDTFTKVLRRLYDENGFSKDFHLHTLRHFFVTTLLHGGVDKQTVADLAGHCDSSYLERTYCHPQMELKRQAAGKMASTMFTFTTIN